jgi:FtsH-binding integral membrane protein
MPENGECFIRQAGEREKMSNNQYTAQTAAAGVDVGLRSHMTKTYNLIALGLLASAASAYVVAETPLRALFFDEAGKTTILGLVGMFAPLIMLFAAGWFAKTVAGVRAFYWTFVALQGIGLSVLVSSQTGGEAARALAITAATFGATSVWGYTTKRNLTGMGSFMMIGLIGLIVALIVQIFVASSALGFAIDVVGVLVFAGLTAYDTQNLKESYDPAASEDSRETTRYWSAIGLYLNILNLYNFISSLGR